MVRTTPSTTDSPLHPSRSRTMLPPRHIARVLCLALLLICTQGSAQVALELPADLTESALEERKNTLQNLSLYAAVRSEAIRRLNAAQEDVRAATRAAVRAASFAPTAVNARLEDVRRQSDRFKPDPIPTADDVQGKSVDQVDQAFAVANNQATIAAGELQELEARAANRTARRAELSRRIEELEPQLAEAQKNLEAPAADNEGPLREASELRARARVLALAEEKRALESQLSTFELQGTLLDARRDFAARRVTAARSLADAWQERAEAARREDTEEARKDADRAKANMEKVDERLVSIAKHNWELAQRRAEVKKLVQKSAEALTQLRAKKKRVREDYKSVQTKVKAVGSTDAIGLLLRKELRQLPSISEIEGRHQNVRTQSSDAILEKFKYEEVVRNLRTPTDRTQRKIEALELSIQESVKLGSEALQLFEEQTDLYPELVRDLETYVDQSIQIGLVESQLIEVVRDFRVYIGERVLWIRSTQPAWKTPISDVGSALVSTFAPGQWTTTIEGLVRDFIFVPVRTGAIILVIIALVFARKRLRSLLRSAGDHAAKRTTTSFTPTAVAFMISIALGLMVPSLLFLIGHQLHAASGGSALGRALSAGFMGMSIVLLAIETVRQQFRPNGLGRRHFNWLEENVVLVRKELRWLIASVLPLTFIVTFFMEYRAPLLDDSIGRLAFMSSNVLLIIFVQRIFGANRLRIRTEDSGPAFERRRRIIRFFGIAVPAVLFLFALLGYYYTAIEISKQCFLSGFVFIGVALIHYFSVRIIRLSRKHLWLLERKARVEAAQADPDTAGPSGELASLEITSDTVDAGALDVDVRKLLRAAVLVVTVVGLWFIWSDELPALQILDTVDLWSYVEEVATPDEAGVPGKPVETFVPVTLADVLFAITVAALTAFGGRHVPSVLELGLLRRLSLQPGERYAVTTVVKYIIWAVGFSMLLSNLGFGWSKIQWLVAALSVGLGFGLQEIFANFVSGLIILFEQPIRIGDVVTVDDVSGGVTRIRIRSTTITDWDRKEYIVPNKEFVTGRLLNWTLSDKVNRIVVNVGVAYGSDTERARKLLLEAADEIPDVLKTPEPIATFDEFGDSTLNLVLRCFLPAMERRLLVRTQLHELIDRKFKAAGLEIAFPQRDLHIRSGLEELAPTSDRSSPQDGTTGSAQD